MTDDVTISSRLAEWAVNTRELDDEIAADVRRRVLDSIGIMFAASATTAEAAAIRQVVGNASSGRSTAVGGEDKCSLTRSDQDSNTAHLNLARVGTHRIQLPGRKVRRFHYRTCILCSQRSVDRIERL